MEIDRGDGLGSRKASVGSGVLGVLNRGGEVVNDGSFDGVGDGGTSAMRDGRMDVALV